MEYGAVRWPAKHLWMDHSLRETLPQASGGSWAGSLIHNKRDLSGQLYMRNRYDDPSTGRFTQEDPIGIAGGLNVYGFADGNPALYDDPYGLRVIVAGDARTRARILRSLYMTERSETFRDVYNTPVRDPAVTVRIEFGGTCPRGYGACTFRRGRHGATIRLLEEADGLDPKPLHEFFHAAGLLADDVDSGVPGACGNDFNRAAMESRADDLERRASEEIETANEGSSAAENSSSER